MISFRPREVTIRACLHLCNVRVWTCACAFAIAVEEKEATPRIERECIGCFTAVSKPGDSEWEGRRGGEDKENGCKRFGSWYPRPPGRLKSLRVYFRCLATRVIAEKPQHIMRCRAKTEDFFLQFCGGEGIPRSLGIILLFSLESRANYSSSIAILDVIVGGMRHSWPCSLSQQWDTFVLRGTRSRTTTDNNKSSMGTRTTYYLFHRDLFLFWIRP